MSDFIDRFFRRERTPKSETPFPKVDSYEHFKRPEFRHDAYEFCKEFTEYLHRTKAKNVIFLDRAARMAWVGVHEYWKEYFPNEEMPGMYFVNPDSVGENVQLVVAMTSLFGANPFPALRGMTEKQQQEFADTFQTLMKQKGERLVVFDTCTHSGRHLLPVMAMLEGNRFTNMRIVTANAPDAISPVVSDARLDRRVKMHNHYPFGHGRYALVQKGDHIVSLRGNDADKEIGARLRRELRQIIRDKGV